MSRKRQAVVIIHGIGEQRPMTTLRGFVASILNYEKAHNNDNDPDRTSWTKPDRINNSYELRKISSKGRKGVRSTTHFYEYHWAGNMRDTNWTHVISWFKSLMGMNPFTSHYRIWILWLILWVGTVTWFAQLYRVIDYYFISTDNSSIDWSNYQIIVLFLPIVFLLFSNIFIGFIGDAARYLKVDLDNIAQREIIRKNGIDLLKALHKSNDYDRIILVGHSLGTVIAYDIMTYLWIDFNKSIQLNIDREIIETEENGWGYTFGSLKHGDEDLTRLEELSDLLQKDPVDNDLLIELQKIQHNLWNKTRHNRKGWLISDLVTLGSPLTHGNILMAENDEDFKLRIEEREYPICPPQKDGTNFSYLNGDGERFLHHATPFAVTRWSNLYYPGDFIGGKVGKLFGHGVLDQKVYYSNSWLRRVLSKISPLTHVAYWQNNSTRDTISKGKEYEAIGALYRAMRLNDLENNLYE